MTLIEAALLDQMRRVLAMDPASFPQARLRTAHRVVRDLPSGDRADKAEQDRVLHAVWVSEGVARGRTRAEEGGMKILLELMALCFVCLVLVSKVWRSVAPKAPPDPVLREMSRAFQRERRGEGAE